MRRWLDADDHIVVLHCKAGKGRSGTVACSYLVAERGWSLQAALDRFTERRMRPGFGSGVSIPSQLRWLRYVDRWARHGRPPYVDRAVEIVAVHVRGLRPGVRLAVEGYVDEGRHIRTFHTFSSHERSDHWGQGAPAVAVDGAGHDKEVQQDQEDHADPDRTGDNDNENNDGATVLFRPPQPVRVPNSDVCIALERRAQTAASLVGWRVLTSVAHTWFNTYFEGRGPEQHGEPSDSGVFVVDWDELDGIKGLRQKGTRAAERISVVWRTARDSEVGAGEATGQEEEEPPAHEPDDGQAEDSALSAVLTSRPDGESATAAEPHNQAVGDVGRINEVT